MTAMRGTMIRLGGLLLAAALTAPPAAAEELTKEERAKLEQEAKQLFVEASFLYWQGKLPDAVERAKRALAMRERLYPEKDFPRGHPDLTKSLKSLGILLRAQG